MIPITSDVANAINKYQKAFGYRIRVGEFANKYKTPEEFVKAVESAIKKKERLY